MMKPIGNRKDEVSFDLHRAEYFFLHETSFERLRHRSLDCAMYCLSAILDLKGVCSVFNMFRVLFTLCFHIWKTQSLAKLNTASMFLYHFRFMPNSALPWPCLGCHHSGKVNQSYCKIITKNIDFVVHFCLITVCFRVFDSNYKKWN